MFRTIIDAKWIRNTINIRIVIIVAVALISVISITLILRAKVLSVNTGNAPGEVSSQPLQGKRIIPTQNLRFTIYPEGIHPRSARTHKGPISILVEDLSGGTSTLLVERLTGNERVRAGQIQRSGIYFRGRLDLELAPGRYRLRIAERSVNEAELIVEP
jgi:hypothetical protein